MSYRKAMGELDGSAFHRTVLLLLNYSIKDISMKTAAIPTVLGHGQYVVPYKNVINILQFALTFYSTWPA